jgi:hypothetical protein
MTRLARGLMRIRIAAVAAAAIVLIAARAMAAPPAPDAALVPPPPSGTPPLKLGVGLHIINIASIDEVREQFEIDGYLLGRWYDPRLSYAPSGPDDQLRTYRRGEVWTPEFEIVNGVTPRDRYDTAIRVTPAGWVSYTERFHIILSSKFALMRFPFDEQSLLILIHPFIHETGEMTFTLYDHHIWTAKEFNQYSSLAQWDLEAVEPEIVTEEIYNRHRVAEARFAIRVKRRFHFYLWKVILPLVLMVVLSWSVFWIEARDLSNQVQIAVTTLLTVIAFAFAISATMPRVPYLTYIDAFFLTCYVFVFLAFVELMAVHLAHRRERATDLGIRIQKFARWAVPAAFIVTNLILIEHFLA